MIQIKKEDFFKLKQLDRIEYRQRADRIDENNPHGKTVSIIKTSFTVLAFVLILSFSGGAWLGEEVGLLLLGSLEPITILCLVCTFGSIFYDTVNYAKRKKEIKKLNEEFFKIELNIKKDKK